MLDLIILALIGICIGVITGLTPGLHVNTIAIIGLSLFSALNISPIQFATVMMAMAVTHTFLDFIPSIFLGAPEEETVLSVLPTHRLLIEGKALEAVKLTAFGSLFGLFFALLLLVPMLFLIPILYTALHGIIVYILIVAVISLILRERKPNKILWAILIFCITGYLGMIIFDLKILSATQVLFPVFVGLFGLSNILASLNSGTVRIPQDEFIDVKPTPKFIFSGFLGSIGGMLVGILPAMSPSQVGVLMYEIIGTDTRNFLITMSAINTSDAIYSLIALYTIQNPRSGVVVMISKVLEVDFNVLLLLIGIIAFTAFFATFLHIKIGRLAMRFVGRVNYKSLCIASLTLILSLVYLFTGLFGVLLALLATIIGSLPILSGVSRTHSMGVLLLPTILYFLGLG